MIATYLVDDNAGHVKIGKSKDPARRLNQLQTANPNTLRMHIFPGDREKELHELFKNLRIREKGNGKEWYRMRLGSNLHALFEGTKEVHFNEKGNAQLVNVKKKTSKQNKKQTSSTFWSNAFRVATGVIGGVVISAIASGRETK